VRLVRQLENIALNRIPQTPAADRVATLRSMLRGLTFGRISPPFNPRVRVVHLDAEKCSPCGDSPSALWLSFVNADQGADQSSKVVEAMFRASGDGVIGDTLTRQLFCTMDKLWKAEGMDLGMSLHGGCVAVTPLSMFLAIEPGAQLAHKVLTTTKKSALTQWLESQCPMTDRLGEVLVALTLSCAAYCVASYSTGLWDRHKDSVLIDDGGHVSHLDFFRPLHGELAEGLETGRSPFVFPPEFAHVIGQSIEHKDLFLDTCYQAFSILRRQARRLLLLLDLMQSAQQVHMVDEVRVSLKRSLVLSGQQVAQSTSLSSSHEAIASQFRAALEESLHTKIGQANFLTQSSPRPPK
jgi:hypothetical protein